MKNPNPSVGDRALPHVRALDAYVPGKQPRDLGWIKLNTNENPYPPSPVVEEVICKSAGEALKTYPDPISAALREQLAGFFGLPGSEWVFVGNGSDEVLNLLVRTFSDRNRPVGYMAPSYSLYPVLQKMQNAAKAELRYTRAMGLPIPAIARCGANIFFLTSPNAPTGVGISTGSVEALLNRFGGVLVVDEAYAAFAEEDAIGLLARYDNLCITRTFSKSHSLAGMRIGFLLGNPGFVELLDKVRDSYNVNILSQLAGLAALSDDGYYRDLAQKIKRTRDRHFEALQGRGWFTYPSQANFLFTEPTDSKGNTGPPVAQSLYDFLYRKKILVRYFGNDPLTDSFLRISIGSEKEMEIISEAFDQWQNSA